jgi:hypothetical protein
MSGTSSINLFEVLVGAARGALGADGVAAALSVGTNPGNDGWLNPREQTRDGRTVSDLLREAKLDNDRKVLVLVQRAVSNYARMQAELTRRAPELLEIVKRAIKERAYSRDEFFDAIRGALPWADLDLRDESDGHGRRPSVMHLLAEYPDLAYAVDPLTGRDALDMLWDHGASVTDTDAIGRTPTSIAAAATWLRIRGDGEDDDDDTDGDESGDELAGPRPRTARPEDKARPHPKQRPGKVDRGKSRSPDRNKRVTPLETEAATAKDRGTSGKKGVLTRRYIRADVKGAPANPRGGARGRRGSGGGGRGRRGGGGVTVAREKGEGDKMEVPLPGMSDSRRVVLLHHRRARAWLRQTGDLFWRPPPPPIGVETSVSGAYSMLGLQEQMCKQRTRMRRSRGGAELRAPDLHSLDFETPDDDDWAFVRFAADLEVGCKTMKRYKAFVAIFLRPLVCDALSRSEPIQRPASASASDSASASASVLARICLDVAEYAPYSRSWARTLATQFGLRLDTLLPVSEGTLAPATQDLPPAEWPGFQAGLKELQRQTALLPPPGLALRDPRLSDWADTLVHDWARLLALHHTAPRASLLAAANRLLPDGPDPQLPFLPAPPPAPAAAGSPPPPPRATPEPGSALAVAVLRTRLDKVAAESAGKPEGSRSAEREPSSPAALESGAGPPVRVAPLMSDGGEIRAELTKAAVASTSASGRLVTPEADVEKQCPPATGPTGGGGGEGGEGVGGGDGWAGAGVTEVSAALRSGFVGWSGARHGLEREAARALLDTPLVAFIAGVVTAEAERPLCCVHLKRQAPDGLAVAPVGPKGSHECRPTPSLVERGVWVAINLWAGSDRSAIERTADAGLLAALTTLLHRRTRDLMRHLAASRPNPAPTPANPTAPPSPSAAAAAAAAAAGSPSSGGRAARARAERRRGGAAPGRQSTTPGAAAAAAEGAAAGEGGLATLSGDELDLATQLIWAVSNVTVERQIGGLARDAACLFRSGLFRFLATILAPSPGQPAPSGRGPSLTGHGGHGGGGPVCAAEPSFRFWRPVGPGADALGSLGTSLLRMSSAFVSLLPPRFERRPAAAAPAAASSASSAGGGGGGGAEEDGGDAAVPDRSLAVCSFAPWFAIVANVMRFNSGSLQAAYLEVLNRIVSRMLDVCEYPGSSRCERDIVDKMLAEHLAANGPLMAEVVRAAEFSLTVLGSVPAADFRSVGAAAAAQVARYHRRAEAGDLPDHDDSDPEPDVNPEQDRSDADRKRPDAGPAGSDQGGSGAEYRRSEAAYLRDAAESGRDLCPCPDCRGRGNDGWPAVGLPRGVCARHLIRTYRKVLRNVVDLVSSLAAAHDAATEILVNDTRLLSLLLLHAHTLYDRKHPKTHGQSTFSRRHKAPNKKPAVNTTSATSITATNPPNNGGVTAGQDRSREHASPAAVNPLPAAVPVADNKTATVNFPPSEDRMLRRILHLFSNVLGGNENQVERVLKLTPITFLMQVARNARESVLSRVEAIYAITNAFLSASTTRRVRFWTNDLPGRLYELATDSPTTLPLELGWRLLDGLCAIEDVTLRATDPALRAFKPRMAKLDLFRVFDQAQFWNTDDILPADLSRLREEIVDRHKELLESIAERSKL